MATVMVDTDRHGRQNNERSLHGIGSPRARQEIYFLAYRWDRGYGHLVCARSLTRYYQPCPRPALIGSQAKKVSQGFY